MKGITIIFSLTSFLIISRIEAITFNDALKRLDKHESIKVISGRANVFAAKANLHGSWGNPMFRAAAKNFPQETLKNNQTPMTGIEMSLSQKIPLSTKYSKIKKSFNSLSRALRYDAKDKKQILIKELWKVLINKRRMSRENSILKENLVWITKMLGISKKLYTNGKISQQALLDIQIRKSEIERTISNKYFEQQQESDKLFYLIDSRDIQEKSIPWDLLNQEMKIKQDNKEHSLRQKLKATEYNLTASTLRYIPDLTFSIGITQRADIDGYGDFIGAAISFPIPFSDVTSSKHEQAVYERYTAVKNYEHYNRTKKREAAVLKKEISKLTKELSILTNKTIKFAKNSRFITAKSYGIGGSSYTELLQSELTLQKILMHEILLKSMRDTKIISLKYLLGGPLSE